MRIKNARMRLLCKKKTHLPCRRLSLERHFSIISFPDPSIRKPSTNWTGEVSWKECRAADKKDVLLLFDVDYR